MAAEVRRSRWGPASTLLCAGCQSVLRKSVVASQRIPSDDAHAAAHDDHHASASRGLDAPVPAMPAIRSRTSRLARGRVDDPVWVRPCLVALLVATAALYLWDLGASGYANSFYSAAVQAGTRSWKAFFFGSSDAAN